MKYKENKFMLIFIMFALLILKDIVSFSQLTFQHMEHLLILVMKQARNYVLKESIMMLKMLFSTNKRVLIGSNLKIYIERIYLRCKTICSSSTLIYCFIIKCI